MKRWVESIGLDWRAVCGTVVLHAFAFFVVASWQFSPKPPSYRPITIEIVELPAVDTPSDSLPSLPEPEPLEEEPVDPDPVEPVDEASEEKEPKQAAERLPQAVVAVAPPPSESESELGEEEEDQNQSVFIDPRYIIPPDPFAETVPSALSRVVRATACSRTSRTSRPAFCPEYSTEDLFEAELAQANSGRAPAYDPIYDIAATQSVLESFIARQPKHGTRSGSAELEPIAALPRHAEALPCAPVQTGLQGPGGLVSGGEEFTLGSTDGIQCR
ncbi:MAG: hypothetical protein AAGK23_02480 [Pseudomonadota bacterium]